MKKIKILGVATLLFVISLSAFAYAVPNQCDNTNVINMIPDAPHPFWGSSTVATYAYTAPNGCVYSVSCVTTYRFWINFGTSAVASDTPLYCNGVAN